MHLLAAARSVNAVVSQKQDTKPEKEFILYLDIFISGKNHSSVLWIFFTKKTDTGKRKKKENSFTTRRGTHDKTHSTSFYAVTEILRFGGGFFLRGGTLLAVSTTHSFDFISSPIARRERGSSEVDMHAGG